MDCTSPKLARESRESQRRKRRAAIIKVASRSFLERGYGGTTMSSIASELGGSKGTLWSYFSCKEELFEAVVDDASDAYRARLLEIMNEGGPQTTALECLCTRIVSYITSEESVGTLRLVIAEAERYPSMSQFFYEKAALKTRELLAGFILKMMDQGMLRRSDPMDAARLLVNLCQMGVHLRMLLGVQRQAKPDEIASDVDKAVTVFLKVHGVQPAATV